MNAKIFSIKIYSTAKRLWRLRYAKFIVFLVGFGLLGGTFVYVTQAQSTRPMLSASTVTPDQTQRAHDLTIDAVKLSKSKTRLQGRLDAARNEYDKAKDKKTKQRLEKHIENIKTRLDKTNKQYTSALKKRENVILKLLDDNRADEVLSRVLRTNGFDKAPTDAKKYIEEHTSVKSIQIEKEIGQTIDGSEFSAYYVMTGNKRTRLYLNEELDSQLINQKVSNQTLFKINNSYVAHAGDFTLDRQLMYTTPSLLPKRKIAAMIIDIKDRKSLYETSTPQLVHSRLFSDTPPSLKTYLSEVTYGKLAVTGDVLGPFTVNMGDKEVCAASQWIQEAQAQLKKQGRNLDSYTNVIYFLNSPVSCGWGGMTSNSTPDNPHAPSIHIHYPSLNTIAHEFGHTLGLGHASTFYACTVQASIPNHIFAGPYGCSFKAYGDPYDSMNSPGNARLSIASAIESQKILPSPLFSVYYRASIGALPAQNTKTIETAGTYDLYSSASLTPQAGKPRLLRIPVDTADKQSFYYLEYRQPNGAYDTFDSTSNIVNGITVRYGQDYDQYYDSGLIDATPSSDKYGSFEDAALTVGKTVALGSSGDTKISLLRLSGGVATVKIERSGSGCDLRAPRLVKSETNPVAAWVNPGQMIRYMITIKNPSSLSCPPQNFNTALEVTDGMSAKIVSGGTGSLKSQAATTVVVEARSNKALPSGNLNRIAIRINSAEFPAPYDSTGGTYYYNIDPDNLSPVVNITKPDESSAMGAKPFISVAADVSVDADTELKQIVLFVNKKVIKTVTNSETLAEVLKSSVFKKGENVIEVAGTDSDGRVGRQIVTIYK